MSNKQFATKVAHAIILTVFTAGSIHLLLAIMAALIRHDLSFINPVNVLGLQLLFPSLAHSFTAFAVGWFSLVGLGVLYLFWLIHYKRYLAIIGATNRYQKMKKLGQLNAELQALIADFMQLSKLSSQGKRTIRRRINKIISIFQ